ncbi:MAG: purine-binding chemotaxis protein CheW [Betaproteobacteria bacterium]|nr:purine-binding chemotaxis protein CheW [Betaproteobacteria bacterium]
MGQLVHASAGKSAALAAVLAAGTGDVPQYLTFSLGGEMYALGILNIKEIIEFGNLTEIPMMPAFIRGVINMRGSVVPVVDLLARFGGKKTEAGRRTCIVIIELSLDGERHDIGVMVDAVSAVLEIPRTEIEPPPSFGAKIRTDFIDGMGKVAGKFVIILNSERVLSVDEMAVLANAGAQGEPQRIAGAAA